MKRSTVAVSILALIVLTFVVLSLVAYWRVRSEKIVLGLPSGELAFNSDRTGMWDAFTLAPDGTLFNLTGDGGGHDYFVSWAMKNDMLNFLSSRSGEMGPAQVRPDGSDLHTLSILEAVLTVVRDNRIHWDSTWSPDSRRIVWASVRDLNLEIYLADSDGENERRLTNDSGRDWFPSWSPDGTRIAFSSDREGNENIYVFDLESDTLTRLTDHPAHDFFAVWSMDSETILFVSERNRSLTTGRPEFFLINSDGSDLRPLGEDDIFIGDPTYSADGQQVAYISNEERTWTIYVMDGDGENVRRITDLASNDLFPVWRPIPEDAGE
jgi:TolB protein